MIFKLPIVRHIICGTIPRKIASFRSEKSNSVAVVLALLALTIFPISALASSGDESWERSADIGDSPVNATIAPQESDENSFVQLFENLIDMFEDYEVNTPSVDALAIEFGNSPETAFEYLRDRIRTEPYLGTLRRPASVLAASGGNTQDKAELLMQLLRKMGLDARIATAPMTEEISQRLKSSSCSLSPEPDKYVRELMGMSRPSMQQAINRARRDYGLLLDAAASAVDASQSISSHFGATHYWVQYRAQDGWRDLDPSVPDLKAGEALATPKALSEGGADPHMVTISVVTETLSDGRLTEKTVLNHEMAARDADITPIQLGFTPANAGVGGVLSNKLGTVLNQAIEIKPLLMLDWEPMLGESFSQPGRAPTGGLTNIVEENPVTAVYLDIQSSAPEGKMRTARRVIVDLIPNKVRESEAISLDAIKQPAIGQYLIEKLESMRQIIISNGGLDPMDYVSRLVLIVTSTDEIASKILDGTIKPESMAWMAWTSAHGLAAGAERVTRNLQSPNGDICGFMGHANVMIWGIEPRGPDHHGTWIDWTIDGVDLASHSAAPDSFEMTEMQFWYGAVRSAIETEVMASFVVSEGEGRSVSTSTQLTGPLKQLSMEAVSALNTSAAQRDSEHGYVLFGAPEPPSEFAAWWRIDPASGKTDARLAEFGNSSFSYGPNFVDASKGGVYQLGQEWVDYLEGEKSREQMLKSKIKLETRADRVRARVRASGRARTPARATQSGDGEYLLVLSIGVGGTIIASTTIGLVLYDHFYGSLFGSEYLNPE